MADYTDKGEAFDWDTDEVSDEGGFTLLPAGTYAFEVLKIDRERFEGSDKMAACPRAAITLNILTDTGWVSIIDKLMLNTKMSWRIAKFFEGLGYTKNPETGKVPARWNEAPGKQGWVKLKVRKFKRKDGSDGEMNEVDAYLAPSDWPQQAAPAPVAAPLVTQQYATAPQTQIPMPAQPVAQPPHPGGYYNNNSVGF